MKSGLSQGRQNRRAGMNNGNPILLRRRAKQFVRRSNFLATGLWGQYALDVVLDIALCLAVAALLRDRQVRPPQAPLVAGQRGLPPFHVIQLADLRVKDGDAPPTAERAADVLGRYAFQFVKAGDVIDPDKLSRGDRLSNQLEGRILVGLKVKATNVFAGMNPPFTASLTGAPAERGTTTLLVRDLTVLDLQTQGDGLAAVLAVPAADQPTLAAFIGRSDLLLVADHR
jgi:hypothetical protein